MSEAAGPKPPRWRRRLLVALVVAAVLVLAGASLVSWLGRAAVESAAAHLRVLDPLPPTAPADPPSLDASPELARSLDALGLLRIGPFGKRHAQYLGLAADAPNDPETERAARLESRAKRYAQARLGEPPAWNVPSAESVRELLDPPPPAFESLIARLRAGDGERFHWGFATGPAGKDAGWALKRLRETHGLLLGVAIVEAERGHHDAARSSWEAAAALEACYPRAPAPYLCSQRAIHLRRLAQVARSVEGLSADEWRAVLDAAGLETCLDGAAGFIADRSLAASRDRPPFVHALYGPAGSFYPSWMEVGVGAWLRFDLARRLRVQAERYGRERGLTGPEVLRTVRVPPSESKLVDGRRPELYLGPPEAASWWWLPVARRQVAFAQLQSGLTLRVLQLRRDPPTRDRLFPPDEDCAWPLELKVEPSSAWTLRPDPASIPAIDDAAAPLEHRETPGR